MARKGDLTGEGSLGDGDGGGVVSNVPICTYGGGVGAFGLETNFSMGRSGFTSFLGFGEGDLTGEGSLGGGDGGGVGVGVGDL